MDKMKIIERIDQYLEEKKVSDYFNDKKAKEMLKKAGMDPDKLSAKQRDRMRTVQKMRGMKS